MSWAAETYTWASGSAAFAWDTARGTFAATEAQDTTSFSGAVTVSGTLAATEGLDTASFSGSGNAFGTLAATEAQDSLLLNGSAAIFGALDATEETIDTASFGGAVGWGWDAAVYPWSVASTSWDMATASITGTFGPTEGLDTASFSGVITVIGTLAATESPDSLLLDGTGSSFGTLAATDSPDTATFSGYSGGITGTLEATEGPDTAAFASPNFVRLEAYRRGFQPQIPGGEREFIDRELGQLEKILGQVLAAIEQLQNNATLN